MAKTKETAKIIPSADKDTEQLEHSHLMGTQNGTTTLFEKFCHFS